MNARSSMKQYHQSSRFVGLDDRVVLRTEVRGGVPVRRVVTAADVATRHAHPEVHPLAPDAQAVLAPVATRSHVADLVEVSAGLVHAHARRARANRKKTSGAVTRATRRARRAPRSAAGWPSSRPGMRSPRRCRRRG